MSSKKSNFTALTTVDDGSTFDFVQQGQNFKILKKDLLAALGVTGTIVQEGPVTAVPVLDIQGAVNAIRNITGEGAIDVSVDPENGILIKLVGTQEVGTLQQVTDTGNETTNDIILKGSDLVYQDAGGTFIGIGAIQEDGIVNVTSEADFPTPVGGISTLEEKTYLISKAGEFDVSFRLKFASSRTVLIGFGRLFSVMNFTNTSASDANIINDPGISVSISDTFIKSPNAPMFDLDGAGVAILTISNCILDDCANLGTLTGFVRDQINNGTLIGFAVTGGFDMLGAHGTIIIQDIQSAADAAKPTFTMTDSGFTCANLSISNVTASLLTGTNKFADIDPGKVAAGIVSDSSFSSTDPVGVDINNTTPNFIVDRVVGIEATRKIGSVSRAPGTVTIVTQSVPVEIDGSWTGVNLSQFATLNPGIEYIGAPANDVFAISATVSGSKAGGTGSDIYSCAIYINDVLVADSLFIAEISDKGGSFSMSTFTILAKNDHITLYVSNEDSTNDFELTEAKISVNRVS